MSTTTSFAVPLAAPKPSSASVVPDGSIDPLGPGPLREIRLELTTHCNLRCIYCPVSHPGHSSRVMEAATLQSALDAIGAIRPGHSVTVSINGLGESTGMSGWMDICRSLYRSGIPVALTSNLARAYSDEELEVLSGLTSLAVSLDTVDDALLRQIRRKVGIQRIAWNMQAIRGAALRLGREAPRIELLCGLYDRNSLDVVALARFAVVAGIPKVTFWDLHIHPGTPAYDPGALHLEPLSALGRDELDLRLGQIDEACRLLTRHGVEVSIPGGFLDALRPSAPGMEASSPAGTAAPLPSQARLTRRCLDPWIYSELRANGDIAPCCARPGIAATRGTGLTEARNDSALRQLRGSLLSGDLDGTCAGCRLRPQTTPELLQAEVEQLLQSTSAAPGTIETDLDQVPAASGRGPSAVQSAWRAGLQYVGLWLAFDAAAYHAGNPDIAQSGMTAWQHYIAHGRYERRPLHIRSTNRRTGRQS